MSIEHPDAVDFIGIDRESGNVVLTISDHLDWSDVSRHLGLLQGKINSYLRFCESGEILKVYPEAENRRVVINVVAKYDLCEEARRFYELAEHALLESGFQLRLSSL